MALLDCVWLCATAATAPPPAPLLPLACWLAVQDIANTSGMSGLHYWVVTEIETLSPWAQVKVLDQLIDAYLGEKKLLTKYTPMLDQISKRVQREIRRRQLVLNVNGTRACVRAE